jgi:hypothetical protein
MEIRCLQEHVPREVFRFVNEEADLATGCAPMAARPPEPAVMTQAARAGGRTWKWQCVPGAYLPSETWASPEFLRLSTTERYFPC